jgi:ABC-type bacteriocin/lantibiotic exporter with double-glycine peptidase domain
MRVLLDALKTGSPVRRIFALIMTAALIALGLMFSLLLFAFIVAAGLIAWGYLLWKTRGLRRHLREQFREQATGGVVTEVFTGEIIEGEVIRKVVAKDAIER